MCRVFGFFKGLAFGDRGSLTGLRGLGVGFRGDELRKSVAAVVPRFPRPFGFRGGVMCTRTVVEASADGFPTISHYFDSAHSFEKIGKKPVLVLSAEHDCIYPPATMNPVFLKLFPTASCIVAKGQAHCFADAGWEDSFAQTLTGWLSKSFTG